MDDKTYQALSVLLGKVIHESPALGEILDRAKAGELTELEALTKMAEIIKSDSDLEQRLLQSVHTSMVPAGGSDVDVIDDPRAEWLVRLKPNGLPQLNPFFEAYLIERGQFDGDMPELRVGPLAEGVAPSVSVDTKARNPALIGKMMDTASKKVRKEIDEHEAERRKLIQGVSDADEAGQERRPALEAINATDEDLSLVKKHATTIAKAAEGVPVGALIHGSPETDHPSYRRREVPKPVKVSRVRGSTLAKMTDKEKRENAWKFLSTTQGRRTAVITVRELIAEDLGKKGIEVTERDYDKKRASPDILAHHEWMVQLSGPGSTQASFSLIDMAAKALSVHLAKDLPKDYPSGMILEVNTVDKLADRKVGWAARLLPPMG